jgi:hypothetical protein
VRRARVRLALVVAAALAAAATGCGRTSPLFAGAGPCTFDSDCPAGRVCLDRTCVTLGAPDGGDDAPPPLKQFGEPCALGWECQSGYCLPGLGGSFCTVRCAGPCPVGYDCKLVPDPNQTGASLGLCAVAQATLCQPCGGDEACGASGGDTCLPLAGGASCGRDCTFTACPDGYVCGASDGGVGVAGQCAPVGGTCQCTRDTVGLSRGCSARNDYGSCAGAQVCTANGPSWGPCSAPVPGPEVCNGVDDDCDGRIDDGLEPRTCDRQSGPWSCTGTETCTGAGGWVCDAPVPEAEKCDYADNNCDGRIDEDFVDAAGRYTAVEHCGGCGNDCRALVPHVSQAVCVLDDRGAPACRAKTCAPGYFPYLDGRICLALPANLCADCAADADCVAPGSRCLDLGLERACGRDCALGSPYGTACPAGYACVPVAGGSQCSPTAGTCVCTAATAGAMRACTIDTCGGFQTCAQVAAGWAWSVCDVAPYNPEICDALDNDCDGVVDNGFLDPVTGKYVRDDNCGFCNNDCSKYWSATLQHATGVCDPAPALPTCRLQCVPGWVDVNGTAADGCECQKLADDDPPDEGPYPAPGQATVDANCDGVDGVIGKALFVSAAAAAGGDGSMAHPYRTIAEALAAFPGSGRQYVLVAEGTYRENVTLAAGVQLFGGYSGSFRARDVVLHTSVIEGQAPGGSMSGARGAVHAEGIAAASPRTVVSGFTILGANLATATPQGEDGAATVAVYVKDCGSGVTFSDNAIVAGRGGEGGRGATGGRGYGRQTSAVLDGAPGLDDGRLPAPCQNLSHAGGAGGVNPTCGASAAPGAGVVCPAFDWTPPKIGAQQEYVSPTGGNGAGGYDLSFDDKSGPSCSHMTQGTFPGTLSNHNGEDGAAGATGPDGAGGAGCASPHGSIAGGVWVPGAGAQGGVVGANGVPGGGGGAGGGVAAFLTGCGTSGCCPSFEYGATGGGGGAGACGGGGGRAGRSGGASIAVLVVFTAPPASLPRITANRVQRNFGGDGGEGGFGGLGGVGGAGGAGGLQKNWSGSYGGKGGDGGDGGSGGGGGGGCGGPSFGLLAFNADATALAAGNAFVTDDAAATGGLHGEGGSSTSPPAYGTAGLDGAARNVLGLWPCSAGCPADRHCDVNGVCVPN